jgi:hypothetical protein
MNSEDGYIHLKGAISQDTLEKIYSNMNDSQMNYTGMKTLIDQVIQSSVNPALHWQADYIKFRVSDNNNSVDASAFHRDIFNQTDKMEDFPCYTCIMYLDKTVMEVVPGSHLTPFLSHYDALIQLLQVKKIYLNVGDILVFNARLLHRGIFTENLPHRRVIQIFEMFTSSESLSKNVNRIVYKLGDETFANAMKFIAKINWIIYIFNLSGYFNSATGYGILKNCNMQGMDYLSPEGTAPRINVVPNTWQELNKYYVIKSTRILPDECVKEYTYECYNKKGFIYLAFFLITSGLVGYILYTRILVNNAFFNNTVKYIKKLAFVAMSKRK